jgi:hypothetical protein
MRGGSSGGRSGGFNRGSGGSFRGYGGGGFRSGPGFRSGTGFRGFSGSYGRPFYGSRFYGSRYAFSFGFGGYYGYPYYYDYGYYPYSYGYPAYSYGYPAYTSYSPSYGDPYYAPAPVVTQNFSQPAASPQEYAPVAGDAVYREPIYLIAFRDHKIQAAIAYWVEGDTLHIVTREHEQRQIPLADIDRSFSEQLNRDRRVEFRLPR